LTNGEQRYFPLYKID